MTLICRKGRKEDSDTNYRLAGWRYRRLIYKICKFCLRNGLKGLTFFHKNLPQFEYSRKHPIHAEAACTQLSSENLSHQYLIQDQLRVQSLAVPRLPLKSMPS